MRMNSYKKRLCALALIAAMCLPGCSKTEPAPAPVTPDPAPSAPEVVAPVEPVLPTMNDEHGNAAVGTNGAVSCNNELASQAGLDILQAGGNAVDAAVATAFAIGVVEPWLSGIGGCGMMNMYFADTKEFKVMEYMETLPDAELGWFNPDTDKKTAKNAAVPSQVAGLLEALEKYGTMTPEEVLAPAIKLAREGYPYNYYMHKGVVDAYDVMSEEAMAIYTHDGIPMEEGDIVKNEPLAQTLEAIAKGGAEAFYEGEIAEKMIEALNAAGNPMSMEDLAAYEPVERETIRTEYYGYEIVTVPPPSCGGDWLLEALNIMEEMDIAQYEQGSEEYMYVFTEATRIGLSDAYSYIGDPAFFDLPIETLISQEYAAERAKLLDLSAKTALTEVPYSDLPVEKLVPTGEDSKHTTHLVVTDAQGNCVSSTNTLGNSFGSKFYAPGLGFFYNSHVSNLDHSNPDSPDYVMPGKRVRSSMAPTIVLKDGEPILVLGSPGSNVIPPVIATIINSVLLYDMELQDAINAPRALALTRSGTQASTKVTVEADDLDAEMIAALEAMGYTLDDKGSLDYNLGCITALYFDQENDVIFAGADPRRDGQALAY